MNSRQARHGSALLILFLVAITPSCANKSYRSSSDSKKRDEAALQRALAVAAADANELNRKPASNESVRARVSPDFEGLRKEFKMLVFQKISSIASKSAEDDGIEFSRPETYTFRAQRLGLCADLAKQKVKALSNRTAFAPVADQKGLECAAIHVLRTEPALRPASYSSDVIGMTFYIDSEYRAYGTDTEIAYNRKNIKRVTLKQDPLESLSSGLTAFPIDLPNAAAAAKATNGPLAVPSDAYVTNKMKKLGAADLCAEGTVFKYHDTFGNPARIGWCSGARWPSVIETNRYFAVIKAKN